MVCFQSPSVLECRKFAGRTGSTISAFKLSTIHSGRRIGVGSLQELSCQACKDLICFMSLLLGHASLQLSAPFLVKLLDFGIRKVAADNMSDKSSLVVHLKDSTMLRHKQLELLQDQGDPEQLLSSYWIVPHHSTMPRYWHAGPLLAC